MLVTLAQSFELVVEAERANERKSTETEERKKQRQAARRQKRVSGGARAGGPGCRGHQHRPAMLAQEIVPALFWIGLKQPYPLRHKISVQGTLPDLPSRLQETGPRTETQNVREQNSQGQHPALRNDPRVPLSSRDLLRTGHIFLHSLPAVPSGAGQTTVSPAPTAPTPSADAQLQVGDSPKHWRASLTPTKPRVVWPQVPGTALTPPPPISVTLVGRS